MGIRIGLSEKKKEIKTIIGADFNARTGNLGGGLELEEEEEWNKGGNKGERNSKDKKVNKKGRILVECLEERSWSIFNGKVKGDEEGEYTGRRGNTVIDYVIRKGQEMRR